MSQRQVFSRKQLAERVAAHAANPGPTPSQRRRARKGTARDYRALNLERAGRCRQTPGCPCAKCW